MLVMPNRVVDDDDAQITEYLASHPLLLESSHYSNLQFASTAGREARK